MAVEITDELRAKVAEATQTDPKDLTDEQIEAVLETSKGLAALAEPDDKGDEDADDKPDDNPDETKDGDAPDETKVGEEVAEQVKALEAKATEQAEQILALERKAIERPIAANVKPQFPLNKKVLTFAPEATTHDEEMQRRIKDWHEFNDDCVFLHAILTNGGRNQIDIRQTKHWKHWVKDRKDFGKFVAEYEGFHDGDSWDFDTKATLTTTTAADYIPVILSSELIKIMRHGLSAAASVRQFNMTDKVHDIPGEGADVTVYKTVEEATVTQADTDDRKVTLDAVDIKARSKYTQQIDEDSIIPVLPLHKEKHTGGLARGIEWAVIHGDVDDAQGHASNTTMTNYTMHNAWDGLHNYAIEATAAETAVGGALWDGQDTLAQIDVLDNYGQDAQCCWLMHPVQHSRTRMMVDYQGTGYRNPMLVPGGAASPITGLPVDAILGFPIITSGEVSKNLSTSGYYDGSTTDRTVVYLYNHRAFMLGDRSAITVETDKTIATGVIEIVTTWRGDFVGLYAITEPAINAAINIDYDAVPA